MEDNLYRFLFNSLDLAGDGFITKNTLLHKLKLNGIQPDDPRFSISLEKLSQCGDTKPISINEFESIIKKNLFVYQKLLRGNLIIPDFEDFCKQIKKFFNSAKKNQSGRVADYIPQLSKVDPQKFAMAICTVDGQQYFCGDFKERFCIQSVCKPILYSLALEEHGEEKVHKHIGREPSGVGFNEITLNPHGLPHNPMINAGAIVSCSLIQPQLSSAARFSYFIKKVQELSGNHYVDFDNPVYLSERESADRNFALGYFLREHKVFPKNSKLSEILDFYFQCCSVRVNISDLAIMGATLANSGISPLTDEKVFSAFTVKDCLSLMYSCGMYNYSGEWAFLIGLPAKSGVSGAILAVIPDVLGIGIWSPALDELGNSVRGIEFLKNLVSYYNFHNYDSLLSLQKKVDPRLRTKEKEVEHINSLLYAASQGDLDEISRLTASGVDLNKADYDGRTALHLAASEGQKQVAQYLINKGVKLDPKDRWNGTPLDDAERENHTKIVRMLKKHL